MHLWPLFTVAYQSVSFNSIPNNLKMNLQSRLWLQIFMTYIATGSAVANVVAKGDGGLRWPIVEFYIFKVVYFFDKNVN